jgi:hypothetical protein
MTVFGSFSARLEMVAELEAVKPIRPARRELQTTPAVEIQLADV